MLQPIESQGFPTYIYAKQEFHGPMNSRKRGLGVTSTSWQQFHWISYSFHAIFVYKKAVMFQFFVNEMC